MPAGFNQERVVGAQRTLDITWPGIITTRPGNGTAVGAIAHMTRQASQGPLSNTTAQKIDGVGSNVLWGTGTGYLGRAVCIFRPGTGAPGTGAAQSMDPMVITPSFGSGVASQSDDSDVDDWACCRLIMVASFQTQPSYAAFTGLGCVCLNAGNVDMVQGGAKGFGFCQTADGVMSFIVVQNIGGGITSSIPVYTGNLQAFTSYELRVIGARASTNCLVKVFVNGRSIHTYDWIADSFPDPQHSNGVYGFVPYPMAHGAGVGGGNAGMAVNRIRYMVGATEASLL